MTKPFLKNILYPGLMVAAMGAAHAQTTVSPTGEPRLGEADEAAARAATSNAAFDSMDRNKDGVISRPEAIGKIAEEFNTLDISRDERIDYAEFVAMVK